MGLAVGYGVTVESKVVVGPGVGVSCGGVEDVGRSSLEPTTVCATIAVGALVAVGAADLSAGTVACMLAVIVA